MASGFEITKITYTECHVQTSTGNKTTFFLANFFINDIGTFIGHYDCLRMLMDFQRIKTMDTHQIFAYSVAIVFASWVPFWLEPVDTVARAVIGIACVTTTIFFNVQYVYAFVIL